MGILNSHAIEIFIDNIKKYLKYIHSTEAGLCLVGILNIHVSDIFIDKIIKYIHVLPGALKSRIFIWQRFSQTTIQVQVSCSTIEEYTCCRITLSWQANSDLLIYRDDGTVMTV